MYDSCIWIYYVFFMGWNELLCGCGVSGPHMKFFNVSPLWKIQLGGGRVLFSYNQDVCTLIGH